MFKQAVPIDHNVKPTRLKSSLPWIICIITAGVFLVPLAFEGATICYAQWCEITGKSVKVQTPIIDSIANGLQRTRDLLVDSFGLTVQRTINDPVVTLSFAALLLVLAMAVLRR